MPTQVHRLYRACRQVFAGAGNGAGTGAGVVPPPEEVDRIRVILDGLRPSDVDLSPNLPYFNAPNGLAPVTYLHIYENDHFSIGIFCLPPSSAIPLHNHPGMTVFSKLLFGSMHIKSYDWCDSPNEPNGIQPPGMRLAKVHTDAVFTAPCSTSILYPNSGGNMHCFTAVTACAVLDVLRPPYCDEEGRHCTYYNSFPYASSAGDAGEAPTDGELVWLKEIEKPENFAVVGGDYTGPQIFPR